MTCLSPTIELSAPCLAQSPGSAINLASAADLLIEIPPSGRMDEGDLIELFWDNCYVASRLLGPADIGHPVQLRVPESFIRTGQSRVHYRLMQVGQSPLTSPTKRLHAKLDCPGGQALGECADENQSLEPPGIPLMIARHGVNASQIRRGVPLTIAPYLNMAADDAVTLRWGDARMDLPKLQPDDVGRPLQVWVPPEVIAQAGEDSRLDVTYCIIDRVGNNSRWAPARTLRVGGSDPGLKILCQKALRHSAGRSKKKQR